MDTIENFKLLLNEINAEMEQNFELDENNGFSFLCLDTLVNVTVLSESGYVMLGTQLGTLGDDENAPKRAHWFLEQNDGLLGSNGFTYSMDESNQSIWLSDRRTLDEIENADAFAAWVDTLVQTAHQAWNVTEYEYPYVDDDEDEEDAE